MPDSDIITRLAEYVAQVEREAYNRGYANAQTSQADALFAAVTQAAELLPRIEPLEVRADFAKALGSPLEISPAEPDPGRDWSRVRAEVFKPSGKWMYSVWLDYSTLRGKPNTLSAGGSPSGWHFDGHIMAREALRLATERGTSGVSFTRLYEGWRMFIPDPPQGFPHFVIGGAE